MYVQNAWGWEPIRDQKRDILELKRTSSLDRGRGGWLKVGVMFSAALVAVAIVCFVVLTRRDMVSELCIGESAQLTSVFGPCHCQQLFSSCPPVWWNGTNRGCLGNIGSRLIAHLYSGHDKIKKCWGIIGKDDLTFLYVSVLANFKPTLYISRGSVQSITSLGIPHLYACFFGHLALKSISSSEIRLPLGACASVCNLFATPPPTFFAFTPVS